jgi:hypothetical protein
MFIATPQLASAQSLEAVAEQRDGANLNPLRISPNGDHIIFQMNDFALGTETLVWSRDSTEIRSLGFDILFGTTRILPGTISDNGTPSATGNATVRPGDGRAWSQAYLWVDGALTLIGGDDYADISSIGLAISDDASSVAGRVQFANSPQQYFITSGANPVLFGSPPMGDKFVPAVGESVSNDGSVVVGKMCDTFAGDCVSGIWSDSVYVSSGRAAQSGQTFTGAVISPGGTAVVIPDDRRFGSLLWTGDNGCPIADSLNIRSIPGFVPNHVSDRGSVIVGRANSQGGVWTPSTGFLPHEDALRSFDALPDGWSGMSVTDVSANGTIWMGEGLAPDGKVKLWRATIPAAAGKDLASAANECSELLQILTPTADEWLTVGNQYEMTWRFGGIPDPTDSLVIAYTDLYDTELDFPLFPVVLDTIAGDAVSYTFTVPNVTSKQSALLIRTIREPQRSFATSLFTFRGYHLVRSKGDTLEHFVPSKHGWPFENRRTNLHPSVWYADNQFDYGLGDDPFTEDAYPVNFTFPPVDATPEVFPDWPSWVRAFGPGDAYLTGADGTTPAGHQWGTVLRWGAEHGGTRWGGSCAGMSTTALMKFVDPVRFDSVGATVRTPAFLRELSEFDVSLLNSPPTTGADAFLVPTPREIINARQNYWDGSAARTAAVAGTKQTVRQILAALKGFFFFEGNRFYPTSYLYIRNEGGSGAHAMVPYRLERIPDVEGGWKVFVYDPNHAGDDNRFVEIDSTLKAWRYAGFSSGTWGGGRGSIYLMDPIANYFDEAALPALATPKMRLPAESQSDWLEISVTPGARTTVHAPNGQTLGFADGVAFNGFENGLIDLPPVGGDVLPSGYVVPVGSDYRVEVSASPDSTSYIQFADATRLYNYSRQDAQSGETDRLNLDADGVLAVRNEDVSGRSIRLMGVVPRDHGEVLVDVDGLSLSEDDSVRFSVDAERQLRLQNQGSDKTYDLHLELGTVDGHTIFLSREVSLGSGAIHHTAVDWNAFGTGPVRIKIDMDGDGTIDMHVDLENEYISVDLDNTGASEIPKSFALSQNYPNPFNPTTTISYALPRSLAVELTVVDLLGRKVRVLEEGTMPAGNHRMTFDAIDLPSGVYFYRLEAGDFVETRSMVIVK